MDRLKIIISYEWLAYWRRLSRAGLRSNQGIVLLVSALVAIKYVQVLRTATDHLARGNPRLLLQLLAAIFVVWLFPLAGGGRETFASRKWLHLPLPLSERFILRSISLLIPPSAWLALAGSAAISYPLAHARNPGAAIIAGLLFIAIAWLTGLTISHLLNSAVWRTLCWIAALALLAGGGFYVIKNGAPELLASRLSPAMLVADAAMGNWKASLFLLTTITVAVGAAALWSFKKSLAGVSEAGGKKRSVLSPIFPGRFGGLIGKDFRYFRRLLDTYLGLAAAMLVCLYLVVAEVASTGIFLSLVVVVFVCNAAVAFNCFGLDNPAGLDRYALLPLKGRAILLSKNVAYLLVIGVQLFPMLVLATWRLGIFACAFAVVEATALACAYLAWGNWMSVSNPLKMQFFRFASSGAALVDEIGGMIFGSLPGILMIYLWQKHGARAAGGIALILLLTAALYIVSVTRFGGRLAQRRERIAAALS